MGSRQNVYTYEQNDDLEKTNFINSLERKVNGNENEMITKEIEMNEVEAILNTVEAKKSPGIDGIPYEFYQMFWDLIKHELFRVLAAMKNTLTLSETQNSAVIALHPKYGDIDRLPIGV